MEIAYNTVTGLFYSKESGAFVCEAFAGATRLDPQQAAVVRATFDNVGTMTEQEAGCFVD